MVRNNSKTQQLEQLENRMEEDATLEAKEEEDFTIDMEGIDTSNSGVKKPAKGRKRTPKRKSAGGKVEKAKTRKGRGRRSRGSRGSSGSQSGISSANTSPGLMGPYSLSPPNSPGRGSLPTPDHSLRSGSGLSSLSYGSSLPTPNMSLRSSRGSGVSYGSSLPTPNMSLGDRSPPSYGSTLPTPDTSLTSHDNYYQGRASPRGPYPSPRSRGPASPSYPPLRTQFSYEKYMMRPDGSQYPYTGAGWPTSSGPAPGTPRTPSRGVAYRSTPSRQGSQNYPPLRTRFSVERFMMRPDGSRTPYSGNEF